MPLSSDRLTGRSPSVRAHTGKAVLRTTLGGFVFVGRAVCHVWLKLNYLIAILIATVDWLFLIVWIVRQFI